MYLQELNFILLFTGEGSTMLILSFNALTSPALLKAVRIQVRPWMQWDHSSLRPLWVIKSRTGMYSNV